MKGASIVIGKDPGQVASAPAGLVERQQRVEKFIEIRRLRLFDS